MQTTLVPSQPSDPILAELLSIEALIQSGTLPAAASRLTALGARATNDPRVFLTGIMLAETAGNLPAALDSAKRAIRMAPMWPPALMECARLQARTGERTEAIVNAKRAIEIEPSNREWLERGVSIANEVRDFDAAEQFLIAAQNLNPSDLTVLRALGFNRFSKNNLEGAEQSFRALLEIDQSDELARSGLGQTLLRLNRNGEAAERFSALVAEFPESETYAFYLAVATGQTPERQPEILNRSLFDDYADTFDSHLVGTLGYRMPRKVSSLVKAVFPTLDCNVLDLGCGTGLLGVYLGKPKGSLIGVDLSLKMIEQAAKHGVYDRFHHVNILDALRETPSDHYDVITACDVFIYIGTLGQPLADIARILRPGGVFVATFEQTDENVADDYLLLPNYRYAHRRDYVLECCTKAGLGNFIIEDAVIRSEAKAGVKGFVLSARKSFE